MEDEYLTEGQLLEMRMFAHLTKATLTRWRCEGHGPRCTIVGRQPFYRRGEIDRWLREQEEKRERIRKVGKVALQVYEPRPDASRRNRLGGHKTKSERRQNDGGAAAS